MTGLMPPNATPLERAVDATVAARFPLPTDLISATWNPDTCPADLLGYLAAAYSIDLWFDDWPEALKRQVIRDAYRLHRLKTTPAGIRAHVELTGATVTKIIRPPSRAFYGTGTTPAEREAWLSSLPQIRVYPYQQRVTPIARKFLCGAGAAHQFNDTGFLRQTRGPEIYGRRATYYDRGTETEIASDLLDDGTATRVYLTAIYPARQWQGSGFLGRSWTRTSKAAAQVITFNTSDAFTQFAITRGLAPVDVRPERINQVRTPPSGRAFAGARHAGARAFVQESFGPRMIFDRISLNDPDRAAIRRQVTAWYGATRLGMAPYSAEIRIKVPLYRAPARAAKYAGVGYLAAPDMSPITRAIEAVSVSKAARDTILIDTVNYREVQFGDGLDFGTFNFGEIREIA